MHFNIPHTSLTWGVTFSLTRMGVLIGLVGAGVPDGKPCAFEVWAWIWATRKGFHIGPHFHYVATA